MAVSTRHGVALVKATLPCCSSSNHTLYLLARTAQMALAPCILRTPLRFSSDFYGCDETHIEMEASLKKLPKMFGWRENVPKYYQDKVLMNLELQEVFSSVLVPEKFLRKIFPSRKERRRMAELAIAARESSQAQRLEVCNKRGWSHNDSARRNYLRRVSRAIMSIATGDVDLVPNGTFTTKNFNPITNTNTNTNGDGDGDGVVDCGRSLSLWRIDRIDADRERGLLVFCVPRDPEAVGIEILNNPEAPQLELEMLAARIRHTLPRMLKTKKSLLPRVSFFRTDLQTEFILDALQHEKNNDGDAENGRWDDQWNDEPNENNSSPTTREKEEINCSN